MTEWELWDRMGQRFERWGNGDDDVPRYVRLHGLCHGTEHEGGRRSAMEEKMDERLGLFEKIDASGTNHARIWWWPAGSREHAYDRAMVAYLLREIAKHE